MKRLLLIFSALAVFLVGCTPEENPQAGSGFDVRLDIPSEITIEEDAKSIEFGVVEGKAPLKTDLIILDGPAGQKFCKILSVTSAKVTVELYSGAKEGQHKVSVQRGLEVLSLGTTKLTFQTVDDGVHPESGSTVYGRVACGDKGIEGVVVSDGAETAVTDKNGVYQLNSKKKHGYVFVSVPRGYEVPLNVVFPQIHKYLTKSASVAERVDFELKEVQNPDNFTMLICGDIHLANRFNDREQFGHFLEDVKDFVTTNGGNIYGLTLGDMVWDRYWVDNNYSFPEYIEEMKPLTGLPFFQTPGNHDHDLWESGDFATMAKYKEYIGPSYYSYNLGKIHGVVLDDIDCANPGTGKNATYTNNLVQEQLDWLKKDLSHVSKDTPIIVSMHAQMFANPGTGQTPNYAMTASSASQLEDILDDFTTVHIFTGHTHKMYNVDRTLTKNGIYEHNAGAVCATWWVNGVYNIEANIAADGVPGGYTVLKVNGNDIKWQYKGTKFNINRQFYSYDRNQINLSREKLLPSLNEADSKEWDARTKTWSGESTANEVYLNVWNYDYNWKVEVSENGNPLNVTKVADYDPLHMLGYAYERYRRGEDAGHLASTVWHLFKVTATSPTSTLEIKVTDCFGNVYTESMKRPKEFTIKNYDWNKMQ